MKEIIKLKLKEMFSSHLLSTFFLNSDIFFLFEQRIDFLVQILIYPFIQVGPLILQYSQVLDPNLTRITFLGGSI